MENKTTRQVIKSKMRHGIQGELKVKNYTQKEAIKEMRMAAKKQGFMLKRSGEFSRWYFVDIKTKEVIFFNKDFWVCYENCINELIRGELK